MLLEPSAGFDYIYNLRLNGILAYLDSVSEFGEASEFLEVRISEFVDVF